MYIDWSDFKYFSEKEFRPPGFEDEVPMGLGFLLKLETLRHQVGSPLIIHRNGGFAVAGHAENSLHYMGLAADLHIVGEGGGTVRHVLDQALLAHKWTFLSIGIYPFWKSPGLHLDDRSAIGKEKTVWFKDREGEYHFYAYGQFHNCIRDLLSIDLPDGAGSEKTADAGSGKLLNVNEENHHEQNTHI